MINNITSFNTNVNLNSSSIDEILDTSTESTAATQSTESNVTENFYLSSKSQKIFAISKEFFSSGSLSFNDVDALKERVYQLGLISKQEYAQLTDTDLTNNDSQLNAEMSSQTLADFSGDFIQRLNSSENEESEDIEENSDIEESDENNSIEESESVLALKEAFTTAQTILSDVESAKNDPDFQASLTAALSLFKETINDDSFEMIPLDDKVGISKVYQALEIIDKITPTKLTNEKVNRYIQISIA